MRETPPAATDGLAGGREAVPKASGDASGPAEEKRSDDGLPAADGPKGAPAKEEPGAVAGDPPANGLPDDPDRHIEGSFVVVGPTSGYSFKDGVLTVTGPGKLTISNADPTVPAKDRIAVGAGVEASVTLAGVNIDVSGDSYACALAVPRGAALDLSLEKGSESSLKSGSYRAGLEVGERTTLTIRGHGALSATGGYYAAGIGGGSGHPGGTVSVSGGTVRAVGGYAGAGIGGGWWNSGGATTVSGGTVIAIGGTYGAGIGGGWLGSSGTFESTGSGSAFVLASSIADTSSKGSWSGVIFGGDPTDLAKGQVYGSPTLALDATIPAGKTLTVASDKTLAVASGAALFNEGVIDNYGAIANRGAITGDGVIRDHSGDLFVQGGRLGDDYAYDSGARLLTVKTGTPLTVGGITKVDHIDIGYKVEANLTLEGLDIDVSKVAGAIALEVPGGATLHLTLAKGRESFLKSGSYCAGLEVPRHASLAIGGSGSLSATGGSYSAGIGGGINAGAGAISISGGAVTAQGGEEEGGAGIGGGSGGGGGTVSVSGGTVSATGGVGAAGIGGGKGGYSRPIPGGTFETTGSGGAFVLASSIADTSKQGSWSGVIFQGGEGKVYGKPTLALSATIPVGKALTVPADLPLALGSGVTLTNNGTIENHGGITGENPLVGNGTVTSDAKVELTATPPPGHYGDPVVLSAKVSQEAKTPGSGAAKPTGAVTFSVVADGVIAQIGNPVELKADPGGTDSIATLTLAFADLDYRTYVQRTEGTVFTAVYGGGTAPSSAEGLYPADSESAEATMGAPDLTVEGGDLGTDYTYASGLLTVLTAEPLVIKNTNPDASTEDHIVIGVGITANVTLGGVNIDVSKQSYVCALAVPADATLNLSLAEGSESSLKSGSTRAGLAVPADATLVIVGPGSLSATGDNGGAGIGGDSWGASGGSISIFSGTVTATGGSGSAGIGGGQNGNSGSVSIFGGAVTAKGSGSFGVGIGCGYLGEGGSVSVSGGTVTATGSGGGSGILGAFSTAAEGDSSGNAFILASSIEGATEKEKWSGVVFQGGEGKVYGKPTLALSATIPVGKALTVPADLPLALGDGVTLTNDGAIENHGGITGENPLVGNGTVTSDAKVELTAVPPTVAYGSEVELTARVAQKAEVPGGSKAAPSGTMLFNIVEGGRRNHEIGEAAPLEADPSVPGTAVAVLKVKASGGYWEIGRNDVKAAYSGQDAAPGAPGLAPADRYLSLQVEKGAIRPSVSIEGWTYGQDAKAPVLGADSNPGGGKMAYEYKKAGDPDTSYKVEAPTAAGSYTLRATVGATERYAEASASVGFSIAKAAQVAPANLAAKAESLSTKGDGKIERLETSMEWADSEGGPYETVADAGMLFKAGTYWVRLAADGNHDASPATQVTVAQGPKLKVTLPASQIGYTLTVDKPELDWHGSATLAFELAPGYTETAGFAVKANDVPLIPNRDGAYVFPELEAGANVTVEGVADITGPTVSAALGQKTWEGFDGAPGTEPALVGAQTLTVEASDAGSGLKQVECLLSEKPFASVGDIQGTWEPVAMKAGEGAISLSAPGASYVYVKATDKDGNSSVVSTSRIVRYEQPALSSSEASFYPAHPADLTVQMTLDDNALAAISAGGHALKEGADYAVAGSTATIKASYLLEQAKTVGSLDLAFSFDPAGVAGATPRPTATLKVALGKVPVHPSVSIAGWIFGQAAKAPVLGPDSNPGGGKVAYEYKKAGDPGASYAEAVPTAAGPYALRATVGATERYAEGEATADFDIAKAGQDAPVLTVHDESVSGKGDGGIGGLTTGMEYAASESGAYQKVADTSKVFKGGTYWVRLTEDANHNASPATEVTVAQGPKLKVALPAEQVGYTLTADKAELDWRGGAKLAFKLADGYVKSPGFAVKANGIALAPDPDGTYTLSSAEADVSVAVEGVAPEFTQQTVYDDVRDASLSGMLASGATFSAAPLAQGDEAYEALSKMALTAGQDVVTAYDVKLAGRYEGKLKASFKVGGAYEGKTLTVYHRKDAGGVETLTSDVLDGWASVETDGLSPFLVAAPSTPVPQPAPQPGGSAAPEAQPALQPGAPGAQDAAMLAPQTGDALPLEPLALAALLSGAALVALAARKARRR